MFCSFSHTPPPSLAQHIHPRASRKVPFLSPHFVTFIWDGDMWVFLYYKVWIGHNPFWCTITRVENTHFSWPKYSTYPWPHISIHSSVTCALVFCFIVHFTPFSTHYHPHVPFSPFCAFSSVFSFSSTFPSHPTSVTYCIETLGPPPVHLLTVLYESLLRHFWPLHLHFLSTGSSY